MYIYFVKPCLGYLVSHLRAHIILLWFGVWICYVPRKKLISDPFYELMYSTHDMFAKTAIIRIKLKPMSKMRSDILLYIECLGKI